MVDQHSRTESAHSPYPRLGSKLRTWVVHESGNRWLTVVRRFAPEMMEPLVPLILAIDPPQIMTHFKNQPGTRGVVLWEVDHHSLLSACDNLARLRIAAPQTLPVLAVQRLSEREQAILGEFGCATQIRHPEELPKLTRMIRCYFAMGTS